MSDKMKQWQKNAKDTYKALKDIDPAKATRQQFILFAACVALQGHMPSLDETVRTQPESATHGKNEGLTTILLDYMNEELSDSEKYIALWRDTGNKDFKEIAKQEISHFEILAKYAQSAEPGIDLQSYVMHHNTLLAKLA